MILWLPNRKNYTVASWEQYKCGGEKIEKWANFWSQMADVAEILHWETYVIVKMASAAGHERLVKVEGKEELGSRSS